MTMDLCSKGKSRNRVYRPKRKDDEEVEQCCTMLYLLVDFLVGYYSTNTYTNYVIKGLSSSKWESLSEPGCSHYAKASLPGARWVPPQCLRSASWAPICSTSTGFQASYQLHGSCKSNAVNHHPKHGHHPAINLGDGQ